MSVKTLQQIAQENIMSNVRKDLEYGMTPEYLFALPEIAQKQFSFTTTDQRKLNQAVFPYSRDVEAECEEAERVEEEADAEDEEVERYMFDEYDEKYTKYSYYEQEYELGYDYREDNYSISGPEFDW